MPFSKAHTHISHVPYNTGLYEEDAVLSVQLHVLLLCSERRHAASLATSIRQDSQEPQRLNVLLALSITLKT